MRPAIKLLARTALLATVPAFFCGCCGLGSLAGLSVAERQTSPPAAGSKTSLRAAESQTSLRAAWRPTAPGVRFIGSVDTMKLSRDRASNQSAAQIERVVDMLARSMSTTHVTVDTRLEQPSVIGVWANRIHADGKSVWYSPSSATCSHPHGDLGDGYPSYRRGYLTELHELVLAHPSYFRPGDILDGDPEAENSCWWASHYGCGVQSSCRPCSNIPNPPCSPIQQFNSFMATMTKQENLDLAALGIAGVTTNVHSTDPGTAVQIPTSSFVRSMQTLITVDAYPDERITDPAVAASTWRRELEGWHRTWLRRGLNVSILLGEWGYSTQINVNDATQQSVIQAEVSKAFPRIPFLVGANYWVGPGMVGDGGYTHILVPDRVSEWRFRPGA